MIDHFLSEIGMNDWFSVMLVAGVWCICIGLLFVANHPFCDDTTTDVLIVVFFLAGVGLLAVGLLRIDTFAPISTAPVAPCHWENTSTATAWVCPATP